MKRIELKKVSIVFLTMLLFLSIQIPAFAADTDTTVKIPVEQVFNSKNKDASDEFMYALLTDQSDAPMICLEHERQYSYGNYHEYQKCRSVSLQNLSDNREERKL